MKRSLGPQTLIYPMPVCLVGSYDKDGKANVMNAAWGGICCSEPPCLTVSVRHARWTFDAIMARKAFTVSIPDSPLAEAADYLGLASGRNADKFAVAGLTPVRSELVDAPYIAECPLVVELSLFKTLELGSHVQFIGQILDVKADESRLTDGKPDTDKIDPLIYDGGERQYRRMGPAIAKAFSVGKGLLKK